MDAIFGAFSDALTIIGLLGAAMVGVILAGLGIRVGLRWLVHAMGGGGGGYDGMDMYNNESWWAEDGESGV